jgi:hypothetical protein
MSEPAIWLLDNNLTPSAIAEELAKSVDYRVFRRTTDLRAARSRRQTCAATGRNSLAPQTKDA